MMPFVFTTNSSMDRRPYSQFDCLCWGMFVLCFHIWLPAYYRLLDASVMPAQVFAFLSVSLPVLLGLSHSRSEKGDHWLHSLILSGWLGLGAGQTFADVCHPISLSNPSPCMGSIASSEQAFCTLGCDHFQKRNHCLLESWARAGQSLGAISASSWRRMPALWACHHELTRHITSSYPTSPCGPE